MRGLLTCYLRTFGTLTVTRDGAELRDISRKSLALLTVLATDGCVSRERLMGLLWPESDATKASGSLRQTIHYLRQLLGTPDLLEGRADLSLNPSLLDSDVVRFRDALREGRPREAITLYRGRFLESVNLKGSVDLEQWVDARRAGLGFQYRDALRQLGGEAERNGELEEAVQWWTHLVADDPLDGSAVLLLMRALEAAGRPTAALQTLQVHEEKLQLEMGLVPDQALLALGDRLRHQPQPALLGTAPPSPPGPVALPAAENSTPPPGGTVRRSYRAGIGLLLLAFTAVAGFVVAAYRRPPGQLPADSNLVAVAPFDVRDPSLQLWREGVMDILTEDLDGAGPLSTVAQSVALRRWKGPANRAAAVHFAGVTGAGFVIFGQFQRRGQDSVTIRASLLDRTTDGAGTESFTVSGPEDRMGQLVDSVGIKILRALGRTRPIGSQRHVSIGSRSLPALKEFLLAEQFYRRGEFDSALVRYDRAIAEDATFALALRRMAWASAMGATTAWQYLPPGEYRRRAVVLNHGLSPRDSMLLRVDSLVLVDDPTRQAEEIAANFFEAKRSLEELARRYPDDPGIWYELGESRFHGSPPLGGIPGPALAAFDRAIALDSGFAPAYQHTVRLALQLGQVDRAREYARAYGHLNPTIDNTQALQLARLILDSGGIRAPAVWRHVKTAHGLSLLWAGHDHFRWMVDSAETAVRLLRELVTGTHDRSGSPAFAADSTMPQHLAVALVFRGHLREAVEVNPQYGDQAGAGYYRSSIDRFLDLALWQILPDSLVRLTYRRGLMPESDWGAGLFLSTPRFLRALPYWYARNDTVSILQFSRRAAAQARRTGSGVAQLRGRYFEIASRGYLALLRGDSAEAERHFEGISDTLCLIGTCYNEKLMLAQLLAGRGAYQGAARILDQWENAGDNTTFAVLAALERGNIAERLGDRVTAANRYRFVIDAWRRADPELQPFVAEARAGLQRSRQ